MKKTLRIKRAVFISALLIATGIFTACGKADRKDIERDLSENVTSDSATQSDAESTGKDIPEKLTYTVNGAYGTIKVNADVYADGYGNVPVYNIKKYEKDDAWLDGYAKKFFDDGEYENVKPYMFCSLDELKQEKSFCEELLSQYEAQDPAYRMIMKEKEEIEFQMEGYVEDPQYPDDKLIYKWSYSTRGQDFDYEEACLKGEAGGKLWYMNYAHGVYASIDYVSDEDLENFVDIKEQMGCLYGYCPENTPDIMYIMDMELGLPNECERETAEKEAEKLLEDFGFENMKEVNITPLRVNLDENDDEKYRLDGYIITYAPSVNGIDVLYGTSSEYVSVDYSIADAVPDNVAGQPFVKIGVSSDGIFEFFIYDQYEIGDTLSETPSMLSFEQVDSQVKSHFESLLDHTQADWDIEIDRVQFGYVCITYDGISYAMVPAWRYYMHVAGTSAKFPFVTLCALDGTWLFQDNGIAFIRQDLLLD